VRDDDAFELRNVFTLLEQSGAVSPMEGHLYVLKQNERPREGWTLPLELLGILLFEAINFLGAYRIRRTPVAFDDGEAVASSEPP
jgi:hypothetical protein